MERSSIKILIIGFLFVIQSIKAQGLYVPANHSIYKFLERMEAAGIIENFQNETKPLLRTKIVDYLTIIFNKRFELSQTERIFLNYYVEEFYVDIAGTLDKYEILFGDKKYNPFSEREKFIYAYNDLSLIHI